MSATDEQLERMLLSYGIETFLYAEARALDERRYRDWLMMFDETVEYWAPTRANRWPREMRYEIADKHGAAIFDEDFESLSIRVRRLESDRAWVEYPASRTRHLVTNISVEPVVEGIGECRALSNISLHVSRREVDEQHYFGSRVDHLVRNDAAPHGWKIVRREIYLDHSTILADGISTFF